MNLDTLVFVRYTNPSECATLKLGVSGGLAYVEARDALAESLVVYRLVRACYVASSLE